MEKTNSGIIRDSYSTSSFSQQRLGLPLVNLNGPSSSIIPKGFPGGLLYDVNTTQPYYSDGKGWYPIVGSGSGGNQDAYIFYDPSTLGTGGGWGAGGPSSNLELKPTDPQITTPNVIWSTMQTSGNTSMDGVNGNINIINNGFYKIDISFSVIAVAPVAPSTITILFYGNTSPLTYFSTQTISSNVPGFNSSGNVSSTSMRMWTAGTIIPLRFNWFVSGSASFIFSPVYISIQKIGDYNAVPPYP